MDLLLTLSLIGDDEEFSCLLLEADVEGEQSSNDRLPDGDEGIFLELILRFFYVNFYKATTWAAKCTADGALGVTVRYKFLLLNKKRKSAKFPKFAYENFFCIPFGVLILSQMSLM